MSTVHVIWSYLFRPIVIIGVMVYVYHFTSEVIGAVFTCSFIFFSCFSAISSTPIAHCIIALKVSSIRKFSNCCEHLHWYGTSGYATCQHYQCCGTCTSVLYGSIPPPPSYSSVAVGSACFLLQLPRYAVSDKEPHCTRILSL